VPLSSLDLVPLLFMAASLFACWSPKPLWIYMVVATLAAGYFSGVYSGSAALWILLLGLAARLYADGNVMGNRWPTGFLPTVGFFGTVLLSLALGLHLLPGFSNRWLIADTRLTPDAAPYSVWLGFDETLAGIVILGTCCTVVIRTQWPAARLLRQSGVILVGTIAADIVLSALMGYVRFESKWTPQFFLWALVNLFTTCVSEETFFRGFLQTRFDRMLSRYQWGGACSVGLSAALFGLAHFAGGWKYIAVASVAGVGYGLIFHKTRRLELSVVGHFSLNAFHFLFFTYPRLA
jgi:uncharacterized protein